MLNRHSKEDSLQNRQNIGNERMQLDHDNSDIK